MCISTALNIVVCNLLCSTSATFGATSREARKPFHGKVLPFLPELLFQLYNYLEVPKVGIVVFMHVLLGSRLAIFVGQNFLMAKDGGNVFPLFSSSALWGGAAQETVILIMRK